MIMMLDNVSIHKIKEAKLIVKKLGWALFTIPSYSPKLNKIENIFGILMA